MTEPERDLDAEFAQCKDELERALAYTGGTHTLQDVRDLVEAGKLQLWIHGRSVIVTELEQYPQLRAVRFFLAAGDMHEVELLSNYVLHWAKNEMGCTRAGLIGRPGWARSFLKRDGWRATHIVMEKDI